MPSSPGLRNAPRTTPAQVKADIPTGSVPAASAKSPHWEGAGAAFRALLIASAVAIFMVATLGGVVRVTDSGLGCPDWPLCHGKLIPPLEFHALIEYTHRLAVSFATPLLILAAAVAWWRYKRFPRILVPLTLAVALLAVEVVLGGITVLAELPPTIVTIHLAIAEAIFGLLLLTLVWSWRQNLPQANGDTVIARWAGVAALATMAVLISGSYVVGQGGGTVCSDWPLCNGGLIPSFNLAWLHMGHRLLAAMGGLVGAWAVFVAWRRRGKLAAVGWASGTAGGVLVVQMLAGAANPWTGFSDLARSVHFSLATVLWGSFVVLAALAWRPRAESVVQGEGTLRTLIADYLSLTKPLIIVLLLITALGGMFLAAQGVPPLSVMALVMVGGALGAGGANAINHYLDQDIDEKMRRTSRRPLPGRRIPPGRALVFGILLNVSAFAILTLWVNLLSGLLIIGASLYYIFVYTLWLKRTTPQSIVIGGAAGAVPPLVGWAAITGGLALPALYLFAIIFFWTPPHFWALSILIRSDYARAKVPMMPVVRGIRETTRSALLHSLLLVSVTILFFTVQVVGLIYLGGALILGGIFLVLSWRLFRTGTMLAARHLYLYSLLYLGLFFALVMVDSAVKL